MSDLVESACELTEALDRVRAAKKAGYAGYPAYEVAGELLAASEAVRVAVVALTGSANDSANDEDDRGE